MEDFIKIEESLDKSGLLIDGATETVKHEINIGAMMTPMPGSFIAPVASWLIKPVVSSLINALSGKGVMRAWQQKKNRKVEFFCY